MDVTKLCKQSESNCCPTAKPKKQKAKYYKINYWDPSMQLSFTYNPIKPKTEKPIDYYDLIFGDKKN